MWYDLSQRDGLLFPDGDWMEGHNNVGFRSFCHRGLNHGDETRPTEFWLVILGQLPCYILFAEPSSEPETGPQARG